MSSLPKERKSLVLIVENIETRKKLVLSSEKQGKTEADLVLGPNTCDLKIHPTILEK